MPQKSTVGKHKGAAPLRKKGRKHSGGTFPYTKEEYIDALTELATHTSNPQQHDIENMILKMRASKDMYNASKQVRAQHATNTLKHSHSSESQHGKRSKNNGGMASLKAPVTGPSAKQSAHTAATKQGKTKAIRHRPNKP